MNDRDAGWPPPRWLGWPMLLTLLAGLGLSSLIWNLIALPLGWVLPPATGRRIGRAVISRGYRLFWQVAGAVGMVRLDTAALAALRDEAGLIIAANHPSMLDAMLLVAELPASACVMKAGLLANPLLGPGALLAGYIRNDGSAALVRSAALDLRQGGQLVLFPEGTRTEQAPINTLLPGVAMIAKLAPAPVQTVLIDTASPYLRKGWPLWRLPPLPIAFAVRLGRRFEPLADHQALLAQLADYFAQELGGQALPPGDPRRHGGAGSCQHAPRT